MIRLLCYDITDNKVRSSFSEMLEYQGFDRIQYSVFVGKVSDQRWQTFWDEVSKFYKERCQESDRIYCHVIERDHFRKMSILWHGPDATWILQEVEVLSV